MLQEINQTKRMRRAVESFKADYDAIDMDHAAFEELKKHLDDPKAKAISECCDGIKAQLDEIKKEEDELYANRSQLFEERTSVQQRLDALFVFPDILSRIATRGVEPTICVARDFRTGYIELLQNYVEN
jgi:prefoldin subunit 5